MLVPELTTLPEGQNGSPGLPGATPAAHGDVVLDSEPVGHPTFTLTVRGGLRGRFRRIQSAPDGAAQSADTGFAGT